MEKPRVGSNYGLLEPLLTSRRFRDDWCVRHFLHPKLLRKAREVRVQLEDIMKFQKMAMVSIGTDFDIIRLVVHTFYMVRR
jgi:pre-mRNA-splicing factor ATP-dependent RNA helicase DHX38/PRP16